MPTRNERLAILIDALITGIHAHESRFAAVNKRGDPAAFAFPGDAALRDAAAGAFSTLATAHPDAWNDWLESGDKSQVALTGADGAPTTVEACVARLAAIHFNPGARLPVSVVSAWLQRHAPQAPPTHVRALAALYQLVLWVHLDAVEVQGLLRHYLALKLPTCPADLGLPADKDALVAMAGELSPACCICPFDTGVLDWHLASHKLAMWTEKLSGKITATTYMHALLAQPEIQACATALRALPPQRVVVVGHSFTMSAHWASHASFTDIAGHVVRHFNSAVEWTHIGRGGLTPTIARDSLIERALQLQPDLTILVTISRNDKDRTNLRWCIERLCAAGSRVIVFDCVMVYRDIYETEQLAVPVARAAGATVLEVWQLLDKHPRRAEFPALDVVHTAPPYHTVMATELVRFLAGQRQAAL